MDRSDSPHQRAPANLASGVEESTVGDSKLAQSIWRRYGTSPGVISTAALLTLTRRASLSIGRLPLLTDVSQRWVPVAMALPAAGLALHYRRSPALARAPSMSTSPALSLPGMLLPPVGTALPSFSTAQVGSPPLAEAPSAEDVIRPERPMIAKTRHRTVGPPMLLSERTPAAHYAARGEQPAAEAQAGMFAPDSSRGLGAAILQRPLQRAAGRASQPTLTSPGPTPPAGRLVAETPFTARPPLTSRAGSEGPRGSPPLVSGVPPRPVVSVTLSALTGRGGSQRAVSAPSSGQPFGEVPQPGEGREAMPPATGRGDLGAAIVRRHLEAPMSRAVPDEVLSPGPSRLPDPVNTLLQRSTGASLTFHGSSVGPLIASRPLVARILGGIPHVRLHTDMPAVAAAETLGADAFTIGSDIFFAAGQADFHNPRGVALLGHELTHIVQQRRQEGGSPAALEETAQANESVILHHLTAPSPPTARLNLPSVHPAAPGALAGIGSPLGVGFSAPENPYGVPLPLSSPSTPLVLAAPVQRAVDSVPGAEAEIAPPVLASTPTAELPTATAAESAPEVDVMRLADQVYELLVRRLAGERERRGW
jgi:Domain of unknown function (DUF4157)